MTVIFQLFCAEDLKKLSRTQLDALRRELEAELMKENAIGQTAQGQQALTLEISTTTEPPPPTPPDDNRRIEEALNKRFHEVSQQLKSSPPNPSGFDFAKLMDQHFTEADEKVKDRTILEWAISCELNNFKFYDLLRRLKDVAYTFFTEATNGQRPKGPDSLYSPFYPQHPLANSLSSYSNPKPHTTQDTTEASP
jgi:hypothetical protein